MTGTGSTSRPLISPDPPTGWWVKLATVRADDIVIVAGRLDVARVAGLADTIDGRGVVLPILVQQQTDGRYRVADGRHRYLAHLCAGRDWVTVLTLHRTPDDGAWPLHPDDGPT